MTVRAERSILQSERRDQREVMDQCDSAVIVGGEGAVR